MNAQGQPVGGIVDLAFVPQARPNASPITVKAVDAGSKTITITVKEDGNQVDKTFEVAKAVGLTDVNAGVEVSLQLSVDKKTVIDKGYLTMLDDKDVREVAAKYGDPDRFLSYES